MRSYGLKICKFFSIDEVLNTQKIFDKGKRKATAISITALGEKPLEIAQKKSKSPEEKWKKLCTRYASSKTSNKLNLCTEAFSLKKNASESMYDHIQKLETTFVKLEDTA